MLGAQISYRFWDQHNYLERSSVGTKVGRPKRRGKNF